MQPSQKGPYDEAAAFFATLKEYNMTLLDAHQLVIACNTLKKQSPKIRVVVSECIKAKRTRIGIGITARYIKQLKHVLGQFADSLGSVQIHQISAANIEGWIQAGDYSPASRRSRLTDIRTLFSFAKSRKYITENPCLDIPPIDVPRKTPGILSPRQAAKLMRVAYNRDRRLCPWLALSLFCGIRPEEMNKLEKKDILLIKKIVHIGEEVSKTDKARNVVIPDNCLEWLKIDGDYATVRKDKRGKERLMGPVNLKKRFDRIRRQAGLFKNWPHDAMRHSSVTYLYAVTENMAYVNKQHGHSQAVAEEHYLAAKTPTGRVVEKVMAEEYFAIRPPK